MVRPDAPGLRARLVRLLASVPLDPADEDRYQDERRARNRRHVFGVALALLPVHLLALVLYWNAGARYAHLGDFLGVVFLMNLLALPIAGGGAALAVLVEPRWSPGRWRGWVTDLFALSYVVLAAAMSVNAQRLNGNINVFTIAILGAGLLLRQQAWAAATVAATGLTVLIAGVMTVQPSPRLQLIALTPAIAVTVLAFVLSRLSVTAARTELLARLTIERQRAELSSLNTSLERRVQEQVEEIVARAREIDTLNQHLRAQVIDRSRQLAAALKALGPRSHAGLAEGDTLDGRVEIRGRLGAGAMAEVYRGQDLILGRPVAVKVLRPDSGVSTDVWVRFASEAEAAAAVHHPCVVHTLHVGISDDGRLYQLQELIDGSSLAASIAGGARWPAAAAARIGARIADALAAAHAAGIVHRDVKPSNVMLTATAPGIHLLDFGVSKIHRAGPDGTAANDVVGTPIYMAPEQILEPEAAGAPCDVYALGVLLHELIAGAPPFTGSAASLLTHHVHHLPPALDAALAPPTLVALVLRCLAKPPRDRPTAAEVAAELSALADAAGAAAVEALPRPVIAAGDTVRLRVES